MATGTDNQSCSSVASGDSHSKSKSNGFFDSFVPGYLAKRPEARELVKLKEDGGRFFLRFNDLNKMSLIYCDFKQENGKILNRDERRRKDNLKNTLVLFEKEGSLKKIAAGTDFEHGKDYLKYEVTNDELWRSLIRKYSLQRDPCKNHESLRVDHDETSSDTGLGAIGQSDDPFRYENDEDFPVKHSISGTSSKIEGLAFELSTYVLGDERPELPVLSAEDVDNCIPAVEAVDKVQLTITPDCCSIEGGSSFMIEADKNFPSGKYIVGFSYFGLSYGICNASGDGSKYLKGSEKIPAAKRQGTHFAMVEVRNETGERVGVCSLLYQDNVANLCMEAMLAEGPKSSDPHNQRRRPTSDSVDHTVSNKKFKSCPIDTPLLLYFCDEMAKRGDEDFFNALIKLGILAEVLANRSEYYKDFAETAREHGHNELAKTIAMFSRERPYDCDKEILTIGMLLDAVQTEKSLRNSDFGYSSDSDDDSNSCSSGYNGDCDSEDGQCCTNGSLKGDKTNAVLGSCNSQYDDNLNEEKNSVNVPEPVTRASLKPEPVTIDVEKKEHIFEDGDNGEKTSSVESSLNSNEEETVACVDNKTTDSGCCSHLTRLENAGDVQWKERCEESVVKLEELTGIPDTGTSSFTEYARRG